MKQLLLLFLCTISISVFAKNTLDFDGANDYVDCGNDTSLQVSGKAITLEAWIYATAWRTNAYEGNVICKEYNTSNYGYMLRVGAGGKLNFALGDGSWHEITTAALMNTNTWYHIAGTFDGSMMRVYLNGTCVDSLAWTGSVSKTPNNNLWIGGHVTYGRWYQGQIDEVKIWSVCKTPAAIAAGRFDELCSQISGLRAYYKFNQGKASQSNPTIKKLTDYSGYNNNGTLTNFALTGSSSNWIKGTNFKKAVTNVNDTVVVCDRYVSPSKRFTWTTSGIYNDTIPTYFYGCDSAIKIYLTVKKTTTSSMKVSVCDSFISPSKNYIFRTSGVFTDKIKNKAGCDSVITITLSVGGGRDTIFPVVCKSYTVPSNKRSYTLTGNYFDTLVNYRGCDSVIDIRLTVHHPGNGNVSLSGCSFVTSPSGKKKFYTNGVYGDTIKTVKGCDSFITVKVNILNSSAYNKVTACKSYTTPDLRRTYTATGVYKDTLPNMSFCDSFVTYDVTILQPSNSAMSVVSCGPYTSSGKKRRFTKSGIYKDTLTNAVGCDSVVTITLTVPVINAGVSQNGKVLTSASNVGSYQWVTCPSYGVISGANSKVYTATAIGNYAVVVSDSGCSDTSGCYYVSTVGVQSFAKANLIKVYPNPSNGNFMVQLDEAVSGLELSVLDINGRVVFTKLFDTFKAEDIQLNAAPGAYFVQLKCADWSQVISVQLK